MVYENLHWLHFLVQQIYPLGRGDLPPGVNLPQVKNHSLGLWIRFWV